MKRGSGYTIIEVLIFLAISAFMLIAAMVAIGGRQRDVQFQQAARDFENKINDLISDVEVGYFVKDARYTCDPDTSAPGGDAPVIGYDASGSGNTQGQDGDCVLIGKAIVMGEEDPLSATDEADKGVLRIFDMAGIRFTDATDSIPAQNIEESKPVALYNDNVPVETYLLQYGLEVEKVVQYDSGSPDSLPFLAILNNSEAGTTDIALDAVSNAGTTSAKIVTATFDSGDTVANKITDFVGNWRYAGDGNGDDFTSIVICVSGPNARGISGATSDWTHKETAAMVIEKSGNTQMVFDGSDEYC